MKRLLTFSLVSFAVIVSLLIVFKVAHAQKYGAAKDRKVVILNGFPSVRVFSSADGTRMEKLDDEQRREFRVLVTKKGDDYIWETREKRPLVKTRSGVYTWFLSPTGSGSIKVASREAPGFLTEPLTYMEHITIGLKTITYWGKLEDFQDEPEEYDLATVHFKQGNVYLEQGKYDLAIESYLKAIAVAPEDARYHYLLGGVYSKQGKYDLAIESFLKAITINPEDASAYNTLRYAYYELGVAYHVQEKYDLAIESFQKAIAIDPNLADAYSWLGLTYYNQGKYDLAIES